MNMYSLFVLFALVAALSAAAYLGAALGGLGRLRRHKGERAPVRPAVTILRPICGPEPDLEQNLRTLCRQDYPSFQVVFIATAPDSPAVPVIQRLQADFPEADLALAIGEGGRLENLLSAGLQDARHDLLVVTGGALRVDRHFLEAVAAPFADPLVGAVTCLASGAPRGAVAANLGALDLTDRALPAALLAARIHGPECVRGPVLAVRRPALTGGDEIAEPCDCLADSFLLDQELRKTGWKIHLSSYVVEKLVVATCFRQFFVHELAAARQERLNRPAAHLFGILPRCSSILALFYLILSGFAPAGWLLTAAIISLRLLLHLRLRYLLRTSAPTVPWLLPLRDMVSFGVWVASFTRWQPAAETAGPLEDDIEEETTAAGG